MHCELVVPALFAAREIPRLPSLELLLARGRASLADPLSLEEWLGQAFDTGEGTPPAGAITIRVAALADNELGMHWVRADPVHLRFGTGRYSLMPGSACAISRDEADALVATLNRQFEGRCRFVAVRPDQWCMGSNRDTSLQAAPPLELAAQEIDGSLPSGADSVRWLALLNEIQMLLHDHP